LEIAVVNDKRWQMAAVVVVAIVAITILLTDQLSSLGVWHVIFATLGYLIAVLLRLPRWARWIAMLISSFNFFAGLGGSILTKIIMLVEGGSNAPSPGKLENRPSNRG
jgi:hypothetical protein